MEFKLRELLERQCLDARAQTTPEKKACNGALATRVNECSFQLQRDTIVPNSLLPGQRKEGGANVVTRERQRHTHRAAGLHGQVAKADPLAETKDLHALLAPDCPLVCLTCPKGGTTEEIDASRGTIHPANWSKTFTA